MDAIRITKVEHVRCRRAGQTAYGALHLTAHHLIFAQSDKVGEEMWIPYPLISLVTRLPMTLEGYSPITIHSRNFRSITLSFQMESDAQDVFESIKGLTVISFVSQLYAFFYTPNPPFETSNGWLLYSPREEFARMGVGSRTKAWRFTDINKDYSFCPTYPMRLVVPTRISDTTLQYASKYRSKCRIPNLTYLHRTNYGSITRSSQPMVGITNNRSIQDEKLIEAIFQSHYSPESRSSTGPIYGSTTTNLVIDARPTTNAMANVAKGAGTENMDYYKDGKKAYLGIDNIHIMRDSLNKVVATLREADTLAYSVGGEFDQSLVPALLDRTALRRSGWLRHLSSILEGTLLIVRNIHINASHVLIHCSDGWDRTAQLSSLAQLCLDPFYRTIRGFAILVEKDWLSFGHRFLDRCGHLSSEKLFMSAADLPSGGGAEAAQAIVASVQNKLMGQGHIKETSPVFHQFLECVRQIQRQHPDRFEFNGHFLEQIHYHLYSCQFGTFLFNCERDRRIGEDNSAPYERTACIWDFLMSTNEMEKNRNSTYDASLDDISRCNSDMGVLFPDPKDVRFWHELYGRTDKEMNGKVVISELQSAEPSGPIRNREVDPVLSSYDVQESAGPGEQLRPAISMSQSTSLLPPVDLGMSWSKENTASSRHLAGSMPELPNSRQGSGGSESYKPLSLPSSLTLRPTSPSRHAAASISTRTSPTPRPFPAFRQIESLPGGVRSMWGKLSSNASAAFTAMHDAYDGVTREFKGMSLSQSWDSENNTKEAAGEKELESRERPNPSDTEADWTIGSGFKLEKHAPGIRDTSATSRWPASGLRSEMSTLTLDNPWSSPSKVEKAGSRASSNMREDDVFSTPSLWAEASPGLSDPTVLYPPSRTPPPLETVSQSVEVHDELISTDAGSSSSADPLGVL